MSEIVNFEGNRAALLKGLQTGLGFELSEFVPSDTEYRGVLNPQLLTTLMAPKVNSHVDKIFSYDQEDDIGAMPSGKRFDDKGNILVKPNAKQHTFRIPSLGLQYTINCRDIANKRIPGTKDTPMSFEYITAREQNRVVGAFDRYNELSAGTLLTTDSVNALDSGLYYTAPNYYTELVGGSRAAPTFTSLATSTLSEYRDITEAVVDSLEEKAQIAGRSVSRWVMVCGKDYFNGVRDLEAQENLAREIRGKDLAQEGLDMLADGDYANIRTLEGSDGIIYIKYTASVLTGSKLIADDKGYLFPVGVENMFTIELAPADTMATVGKEAEAMYMWRQENKRGMSFEVESNRVWMNRLPQLVHVFDKDAS